VFTLRCTRRLLNRLRQEPAAGSAPPTTRLGDWYTNLVHVGRLQFLLSVSERTFLPVVVPAAPSATWIPRTRAAIGEHLRALGIDEEEVAREEAAMAEATVGPTVDRRVIGALTDFAKFLEPFLEHRASLLDVALMMASIPRRALWTTGATISADNRTRVLFGAPSLPRPR
jgi:hypothetical protein